LLRKISTLRGALLDSGFWLWALQLSFNLCDKLSKNFVSRRFNKSHLQDFKQTRLMYVKLTICHPQWFHPLT